MSETKFIIRYHIEGSVIERTILKILYDLVGGFYMVNECNRSGEPVNYQTHKTQLKTMEDDDYVDYVISDLSLLDDYDDCAKNHFATVFQDEIDFLTERINNLKVVK